VFSRRTAWSGAPNAIAQALEARRATGEPVLDLTETNPTRVGLPTPEPEIRAALDEARALRYEPTPWGQPLARSAVAAYLHAAVPPEHIMLTASTSEAYAWLFKLLGDSGDRVLAPVPCYPLIEYLAGLEGLESTPYPWTWEEGGWFIDFTALEDRLDDRTKAVVIVSPNNPTGAMVRREELDRLLGICRDRRVAIIADEVFSDYVFNDSTSRVRTLAGREDALVFVLGGLSKACLLPQLKAAWIAASGPARLLDSALARLEIVADTYLSVGTPVQMALPRLLALGDRIRRPLNARLAANRSRLMEALSGSAATPLSCDGGWSAVVRVPRHPAEEQRTVRLLTRHGLRVHPGFFFDFPTEAFLAVSLLVPEDDFARGVAILAADADSA